VTSFAASSLQPRKSPFISILNRVNQSWEYLFTSTFQAFPALVRLLISVAISESEAEAEKHSAISGVGYLGIEWVPIPMRLLEITRWALHGID
jgi:hypothetical protein